MAIQISSKIEQSFREPNIAAAYGPYATLAEAHAYLKQRRLNVIGMTVGIQPTGSNTITEYWYQGGTELANLVEKNTGGGGYAPPAGGIPKSDLSDGVQASLDKADAAAPQSNTYTIVEVNNIADGLSTSINTAKNEIIGDATPGYNTLGEVETAIKAEETRAKTAEYNISETLALADSSRLVEEARLQSGVIQNRNNIGIMRTTINQMSQSVAQLDGHDVVVVDELPASGDANVVYRLVTTDGDDVSYEDYMYNEDDLTTPIKVATYALPGIDEEVTKDSEKLLTSGSVFNVVQNNAVYDISVNNAVGGTATKYFELSDALQQVPTDYQVGGISIKFIKDEPVYYHVDLKIKDDHTGVTNVITPTVDLTTGNYVADDIPSAFTNLPSAIGGSNSYYQVNSVDEQVQGYKVWTITKLSNDTSHYVQYRLMSPTWSTAVSDWQGVDSVFTLADSNIPNNRAVLDLMNELMVDVPYAVGNYAILNNGKFGVNASYKHAIFKVNAGERYIIKSTQDPSNTSPWTRYAFTTTNEAVSGGAIPFVAGTSIVGVPVGSTALVIVPVGCNYLLVNYDQDNYPLYVRGYAFTDEEPTENSDKYIKSGKIASTYGSYLNTVGYTYAMVDANNRLLFGIKDDGSIDWIKGVPNPVKDYITNVISAKVDKEEGKTLIDAELFNVVPDNDYAYMLLDSENHIILDIKKDGTFEWAKGIPEHIKAYIKEFGDSNNNTLGAEELSAIRNAISSFGNKLFPVNIDKTNDGWEIISTVQQNECLKFASLYTKTKWTPSSDVPGRGDVVYEAGTEYTGIPYSSVSDRTVGHNVSFHTFMTAVNNPYSLLYTENTSSGQSTSAWGKTYTGASNARTYYGATCTVLTGYCTGLDNPYGTTLYPWLRDYKFKLASVYNRDIDKLMVGDMILYIKNAVPAHSRLITGIKRNENNIVTDVKISELVSPGGKERTYTRAKLQEYVNGDYADGDIIDSEVGGYGIFLRSLDLYKVCYKDIDVFDDGFVYNDDICTFAGDKCVFLPNELIVLNYNLKNTNNTWTHIEIYKDDVLLQTYSIANINQSQLPEGQRGHALKLGENHDIGMYKARLTDGTNYSDYTYWEVIDLNLVYNPKEDGETYTFECETSNATFKYIGMGNVSNGKGYLYYYVEDGVNSFEINLKELNKKQMPFRPISSGSYYFFAYAEGKYGRRYKIYKNTPINLK